MIWTLQIPLSGSLLSVPFMIFGYKPWNLFWAVKQKRIYWEEGEQWITPRHQGSELGEGQELGAWRAGGMEREMCYPILVRMGWLAGCCCCSAGGSTYVPVLAPLARDAESCERACVCSSLDHRFTPGKGQSTAGSQKRSKHLCLSSQQTFTAGGEIIICGNQVAWKCTRGVGMDTRCPEDNTCLLHLLIKW